MAAASFVPDPGGDEPERPDHHDRGSGDAGSPLSRKPSSSMTASSAATARPGRSCRRWPCWSTKSPPFPTPRSGTYERQPVPVRCLSRHRRSHQDKSRRRRRRPPEMRHDPVPIRPGYIPRRALARMGQNPKARFVAGGTTLLDLMKLGVETPDLLIDINHLGLDGITLTSTGYVSAPRSPTPTLRSMRRSRRKMAGRLPGHPGGRLRPSFATWRLSAATCSRATGVAISATWRCPAIGGAGDGLRRAGRTTRRRRDQPLLRRPWHQPVLHRLHHPICAWRWWRWMRW